MMRSVDLSGRFGDMKKGVAFRDTLSREAHWFQLWYLSFQNLPVLCIMGTQYIVDDTLLRNVVLATNFEALNSFILKQPSGLNLSKTAEHFAKLVQGYDIVVLAPIGFVVFSALHEISSLSRGLWSAYPLKDPSNSPKSASNLFIHENASSILVSEEIRILPLKMRIKYHEYEAILP